jgi:acyl-coenzyme A synthetase/AMP-(fatty) acid ligase
LRLLGSVGEPINPEAWMWYYTMVGKSRCPIVDTWWQTETGCHIIAPMPGAVPLKPGSCTFPLPGMQCAIVDETGEEVEKGKGGLLVITRPFPSQIERCGAIPIASSRLTFRRNCMAITWQATPRAATWMGITGSWAASMMF